MAWIVAPGHTVSYNSLSREGKKRGEPYVAGEAVPMSDEEAEKVLKSSPTCLVRSSATSVAHVAHPAEDKPRRGGSR